MKPDFWKRYSKGVKIGDWGANIVNYPVFFDFWKNVGGPEKEMEPQLTKEAKTFGFRKAKREKGMGGNYCQDEEDRQNFVWCNIQLHIGENVKFDDVETVLVPRYLTETDITFRVGGADVPIKTIIAEANYSPKSSFKGKIILYGPHLSSGGGSGQPHPHYMSVISKPNRDPVYNKILKGYKVPQTSYEELENPDAGILHRGRIGGNSSMIALSWKAYVDAVEKYMELLVIHDYAI